MSAAGYGSGRASTCAAELDAPPTADRTGRMRRTDAFLLAVRRRDRDGAAGTRLYGRKLPHPFARAVSLSARHARFPRSRDPDGRHGRVRHGGLFARRGAAGGGAPGVAVGGGIVRTLHLPDRCDRAHEVLETAGYGCRGTGGRAVGERRRLVSAYECEEVARALAGIVASPDVRIARGDEYIPVEVLTEELDVRDEGELRSLEIEIRKNSTTWN